MSIVRQYQTYYGIHLYHWTENWGSNSYNKFLSKEIADTDSKTCGSTDADSSITFLYPLLTQNEYYIDGVAEGVFNIYNSGASGTLLTDFTVSLLKISNSGVSTELASHQEVLGTLQLIDASDYCSYTFKLLISKQLVSENEKIALKLSITEGASGGDKLKFLHFNDSGEDVWVKIPYVPSSGG